MTDRAKDLERLVEAERLLRKFWDTEEPDGLDIAEAAGLIQAVIGDLIERSKAANRRTHT